MHTKSNSTSGQVKLYAVRVSKIVTTTQGGVKGIKSQNEKVTGEGGGGRGKRGQNSKLKGNGGYQTNGKVSGG